MATTVISCLASELSSKLATAKSTTGIYLISVTDPANLTIGQSTESGTLGYILKNNSATSVFYDLSDTDLTLSTVSTFVSAFAGCTSLVSIGALPTNTLTDATNMFNGDTALKSANVSALTSVTTTTGMFTGCSALKTLTVSKAFITNNGSTASLLTDCTALNQIIVADAEHPALINKDTVVNGELYVRDKVWAQNEIDATNLITAEAGVKGDLYGNSDTTTKLKTPVVLSLSGDITGSASFDGSANTDIVAAIKADFITQSELDNTIAKLKVASMQVVDSLPTAPEEGIIYLVKKATDTDGGNGQSDDNAYDEWIFEWKKDSTGANTYVKCSTDDKYIKNTFYYTYDSTAGTYTKVDTSAFVDGTTDVSAYYVGGAYEHLGDTSVDLTDYITNAQLKKGYAFEGPISTTGNLTVDGSTILNGLSVKGAAIFDSTISADSNVTVGGTITSTGDITAPNFVGSASTAKSLEHTLTASAATSEITSATSDSWVFKGTENVTFVPYKPDQNVNTSSEVSFQKVTVPLTDTTLTEDTYIKATAYDSTVTYYADANGAPLIAQTEVTSDNVTNYYIKSSSLKKVYDVVGNVAGDATSAQKVDHSLVIRQTKSHVQTQTVWDGSSNSIIDIKGADQDVNTTDDVTFNSVTTTKTVTVGTDLSVKGNSSITGNETVGGTITSTDDITAPNFHGTADKVANKLTINQTVSGTTTTTTYDGSAPVSIDIKNSKLTTGYTTDVAATTAATEYDGSTDVTNTYYKPDQNVNIASKVVFAGITDTGDMTVAGGAVDITSSTAVMKLTGDQGVEIKSNNSKDIKIIAGNYDTSNSYILGAEGDFTNVTAYTKATGTYVSGTQYYTYDSDSKTYSSVDTSSFTAGTTDVSSYYTSTTSSPTTLEGVTNNNSNVDVLIAGTQVGVKADVIGLESPTLQISAGDNGSGIIEVSTHDSGSYVDRSYISYFNNSSTDYKRAYVFSEKNSTTNNISGINYENLSTIYANISSYSITAKNNVTVTTATGNSTYVQAPQYKFNILTSSGTTVESTLTIDENKNLVFNGVKVLSQDDYDVIWKRLLALEAKVEAFSSNADASTELTDDIIKNWTGKTDISGISH